MPVSDVDYGIAEGERRKLAILEIHAARHSSRVLTAQRALLQHLLEHGTATIEDLPAELRDAGGIRRPTWLGSVSYGLRVAGLIRRVEYIETTRAVAHRRPVSVWELTDVDAARAWLAEHSAPAAIAGDSGPDAQPRAAPVVTDAGATGPTVAPAQTADGPAAKAATADPLLF